MKHFTVTLIMAVLLLICEMKTNSRINELVEKLQKVNTENYELKKEIRLLKTDTKVLENIIIGGDYE